MQKTTSTLHESHVARKRKIPMEGAPLQQSLEKKKKSGPSLIQQAEKLRIRSLFFIIFIVRVLPNEF